MAKRNKFIFWTPRILLILFTLFLAIFSFDVFDSCAGLECALALFMHNLPSIVLLAILIISWKNDIIGAIIFITLGVVCVLGLAVALLSQSGGRFNPILIIASIVFLVIGVLFYLGKLRRK